MCVHLILRVYAYAYEYRYVYVYVYVTERESVCVYGRGESQCVCMGGERVSVCVCEGRESHLVRDKGGFGPVELLQPVSIHLGRVLQ